jgi:cysteine-rich repeat protein
VTLEPGARADLGIDFNPPATTMPDGGDLDDASAPPDLTPACGNGVREANEVCDDGNTSDGDGCNAACSAASCLVPVTHASVTAALDDTTCPTVYVYSGTYNERPTIARAVIVLGVGAAAVILDGQGKDSTVTVSAGVVTLQNLTIRNGRAAKGGGIINHASLTLRATRVESSTASALVGQGGGVYNDSGSLTLDGATISGNHAVTDASSTQSPGAAGAGLYNASGTVNVTGGSTIADNDITIAGVGGVTATGGGIESAGGSLTIGGSSVKNNVINLDGRPGDATGYGGGIHIGGGAFTATGSTTVSGNRVTVKGNSVRGYGAGIAGGTPNITGARIESNVIDVSGDSSTSGYGGGLYVNGSTTLNTTVVTGNSVTGGPSSTASFGAQIAGGGIMVEYASLVFDGGTISNNSLTAALPNDRSLTASGGGIYAYLGTGQDVTVTLSILRTTVTGNSITAPYGFGGGVRCGVGTGTNTLLNGTISDSTVSGNQAIGGEAANGGGIYAESGTGSSITVLNVVNSTVSGNKAQSARGAARGGGIDVTTGTGSAKATLNLASATISANSVQGATTATGGGVSATKGISSSITAANSKNSIVAGNSGTDPDCLTSGLSIASQGYNFFGDLTGCALTTTSGDQTAGNARLGPLAANGGPTQTHELLAGSPAIDAGNPAGCSDPAGTRLTKDQRGMPRDNPSRCDIGAYEK